MTEISYHCTNCRDHAVTRDYDVSHLLLSCSACGEFARFVNGAVLEQYLAFEASPLADLDWERLSTVEKFVVANGIVREGRTLADFDVEGT